MACETFLTNLSELDFDTTLSADFMAIFSPHGRKTSTPSLRGEDMGGWEVCENLHEQELPMNCDTNRPYVGIQLIHMSLNDSDELELHSRPASVKSDLKKRNKTVSSVNVALRRSKSSRCVPAGSWPNVARNGLNNQSGQRYISRFPMLFHGIREIKYDFRPFLHHQQHADSYRNSYTYILIRNFRELRATGLFGNKLNAALRLNLSTNSALKPNKDTQSKSCPHNHQRPTASPLSRSSIVYYTDECQTGPVVNSRNPKLVSKTGETTPTAVPPSGASFLPKSTMEINAVTLRPSQQRPFGEQDAQGKIQSGAIRGPKQVRQTRDFYSDRRTTKNADPISIVTGKSALTRSRQNLDYSRRMSPLGRIPVAIRRSSPSIRGRRDPGITVDGVNKFLSIAVATHTVASPYHSTVSRSQEDLSIDANL